MRGVQPIYREQKCAACNPYIEQNVKHVDHEAEVKQKSSSIGLVYIIPLNNELTLCYGQ